MRSGIWRACRASAATLLAVAVALLAAPVAEAAAAPGSSVRAAFGSTTFDMADGWGSARACVVYSRTKVRCFGSTAAADAALGYSAATDPLANGLIVAAPACASGWLCLYADVSGGGRRLQFRDEYWNYLSDYGFDRQTSSWRNNQGSSDTGHLSFYNRTTVYSCGAGSYALSLGAYDNQAYAVWG